MAKINIAKRNNVGPNRLVVGAHYGLRDWLAQRLTAILMAVYTFVLLFTFLTGQNFTYEGWAGWRVRAAVVQAVQPGYLRWPVLPRLGRHARHLDGLHQEPVGIRLLLQALTIFWLLACTAYTVQILWSV